MSADLLYFLIEQLVRMQSSDWSVAGVRFTVICHIRVPTNNRILKDKSVVFSLFLLIDIDCVYL